MSRISHRFGRAAAVFAVATLGAAAQIERAALPPGQASNVAYKLANDVVGGFAVVDGTQTAPAQLVQSLLGPGVVATNVVLTGPLTAVGAFSGGLGSVGLDHGVVLSTGAANTVLGPNSSDSASTSNGTPGSSLLNGYTTSPTYDACILEFDFVAAAADTISFQYVFSSEEYNEWVNTSYNDVFAFVLNGQNIALLPSGPPVTINNVNCGNPYAAAAGGNCGLFVNNRCADLPIGSFPCAGAVDCEMDGMTVVLSATGTLVPGVNHIKLAVADAGDSIYDSNVFIRGGSFAPGPPAPYFPDPSAPCDDVLYATAGVPFGFTFSAQASTGEPNNSVTITASPVPAGYVHTPALPVTAYGQNTLATTQIQWTPGANQLGSYQIDYTATDQENESEVCSINIVVVQAVMVVGFAPTAYVVPGTGGRVLLVDPLLVFPISTQEIPQFAIPADPNLLGVHVYAQVGVYNPVDYPTDPYRFTEALDAELGVDFDAYGNGDPELTFEFETTPVLGATTTLTFQIDAP